MEGGSALTSGDIFDALKLDERSDDLDGLSVDTAVTAEDAGGVTEKYTYNFTIKATAEGGATAWKDALI